MFSRRASVRFEFLPTIDDLGAELDAITGHEDQGFSLRQVQDLKLAGPTVRLRHFDHS